MKNNEKKLSPAGERIKERLTELDKNQSWLIKQLECSQPAISQIMSRGSGTLLPRIAKALGVNFEWLADGKGEKLISSEPSKPSFEHLDLQDQIAAFKKIIPTWEVDEQVSFLQWLENKLEKKRNNAQGGIHNGNQSSAYGKRHT